MGTRSGIDRESRGDLEEGEIRQRVADWGLLTDAQSSPLVTNHELIPPIGVVDVHQRGYSSYEPELCRMVREGKADRRQWQHTFELLEYASRTGLFVKEPVTRALKRLGLTPADVGIRFGRRWQTADRREA